MPQRYSKRKIVAKQKTQTPSVFETMAWSGEAWRTGMAAIASESDRIETDSKVQGAK